MYILLPLTVIVWGLIIYKIISAVDNDEDIISRSHDSPSLALADTISLHEINLIANYRDPFLGKSIVKVNRPSISHNRQVNLTQVTSVVAPIMWPQISYVGIIENKKKKTKVAILRIDNTEFLLKEKEISNNVLIEKILGDSIQVVFNKERKIFKK